MLKSISFSCFVDQKKKKGEKNRCFGVSVFRFGVSLFRRFVSLFRGLVMSPNFADMLHYIACANLFFTLKQEPEFLPTAFAVILKPV